MKRSFDIILAALGLVPAAPLILLLALAVRAGSPGPAIFRQARIGQNERVFTCYKLRTMYADTPNLPSHETGAGSVTPIGRLLRRSKLDELPQLFNIVKGEMSFVGPRPCLPSQVELIAARRRHDLTHLRPGITGVSQVAGVDMSDPEQLAALDATYLNRMTVTEDLRLILRTVLGAGAGDRVRGRTSH
jgi:O-antigen biosynthesis protein WbqP